MLQVVNQKTGCGNGLVIISYSLVKLYIIMKLLLMVSHEFPGINSNYTKEGRLLI